jgi:hypothetical protein
LMAAKAKVAHEQVRKEFINLMIHTTCFVYFWLKDYLIECTPINKTIARAQ